jgi:hypothetical protein
MANDVKGEMTWRTDLLERQWQPQTTARLVIELVERRKKLERQRTELCDGDENDDRYPMLVNQLRIYNEMLYFIREAEMDQVGVDMCKLLDLEIPF